METTVVFNNVSVKQTIFANCENGGVFIQSYSDGTIGFEVYIREKSAYIQVQSKEKLVAGKKYNIIGSYDGEYVRLYINGVLESEVESIGTIGLPEINTTSAIGANPFGNVVNQEYANINIYSAKIWDRALTEAEVNQISTGLIREFDASNNTGKGHSNEITTWTDLTGNYDGTITGATWSDEYLALDGTDDWVNLGQVNLTDEVTLEATIVPQAIQSGEAVVIGNYALGGVGLSLWDGVPGLNVYVEGVGYFAVKSDKSLTPGKKYHLLGTYDGQNLKFYIDGKLKNTITRVGKIGKPEYYTVMAIGTNPEGSAAGTDGFANMNIYSAKVYNKTLTDEQVTENYKSSLKWAQSHTETIKLSDSPTGLSTGAQLQYGWSTSNTEEPETWNNLEIPEYTAGISRTTATVTQDSLNGKYYLWVRPIETNYVQDQVENVTTTAIVTNEQYWFDNIVPTWKAENLNIYKETDSLTVDLIGTDELSGIESYKLTADKIKVYIDGQYIDSITKTLSNETDIAGGKKYTLTLSNLEEKFRQEGKQYKEWSGNIELVIDEGTLIDYAKNENTQTTLELGLVDTINPEFTYKYTVSDINKAEKTVKVVFTVTDKYFKESTLKIDNLTILIDGEQPVWKTAENETGVAKNLTYEEIKEGDKLIGYTYTLLLSELEQDVIASRKNYLDYSGVVTVVIPEGKVTDTSDNTNYAQTITVGIEGTEENIPEKEPSDEVITIETQPYIPEGYTPDETTNLDTGFVIKDSKGNEYVWVEVPRTTDVYKTAGVNIMEFSDGEYQKIEEDLQAYSAAYKIPNTDGNTYIDKYYSDEVTGLNESQYNIQKKKMLKSIYKNGGFYVGRYETGIAYDDVNNYRSSATQTVNQIPVIKQNAYPYNYVTVAQSQSLASGFATDGYTSALLFGLQWDLVLKYLEVKEAATEEELNVDSSSWGNHLDSTFTIDNTSAKYSAPGSAYTDITSTYSKSAGTEVFLTTGANPDFRKQNISDLGGNVREWTLSYATSIGYTVNRRK